jgi:hypothetical protein
MTWGRVEVRRIRSAACLGAFALLFALGVFVACGKKAVPQDGATVQKISAQDQLIGGRESSGRIGDWLLSNGRVRFVVEDAGSANGWGLYGGSLVDADRVRPSGEPGDDRLQEIFYQCNLRGFEPTKAEIVSDGRDGQPGVLRLSGKDRGIPLIDAALPTQDLGVEITLDYVLPKDGDTLEIVLRAKDLGKMGSRDLACGVFLLRGDGYDAFTEATGFDKAKDSAIPYLAAASAESRSSYAFYRKSGLLTVELQQSEVLPLAGEMRRLPSGGTLEERFYVSVGSGDVESVLRERRRVLGEDEASRKLVDLAVTAPAVMSVPIAQTVVTFFDLGRPDGRRAVTSAKPAPSGGLEVALDPGSYRAALSFDGREAGAIMIAVPNDASSATRASAEIAMFGELAIDTTRFDDASRSIGPTPAKLSLVAGPDAPPSGPRIVERYLAADDVVIVPAGTYTAYVSRGPEYDLYKENVTITAGQRSAIHAKVAHVVDTTGWISADLHVHSTKSVDADSPRPVRVLGAVAEGVEVLVSTDHDIVTDYAPFVKELGLEGVLKTVTGTEVSPAYGHINAMPLAAETPEAYWRISWYRYKDDGMFDRLLDPAEIVRSLRAIPSVQYIQCNHPRSGQGVFNYIRFDAATGQSEREFPAADGFEILNNKHGGQFDQVFQDFIALIKSNRRMTGTGVSDSHGAYSGVGYARTMIRSSDDDPASADVSALFRAVREGRVVALSGPMVTLRARQGAKSAEIGETLSASGAIALEVHIEAPLWMDVSSYRVLENGAVLAEGALEAPDVNARNPVVRLDRTFAANPSSDAFYLVVAEGAPSSLSAPVLDARARSVTNPVFVDANGDGFHFGAEHP